MPAFNTAPNYVISIIKGNTVALWSAEQPVAGNGGASASIPVALKSKEGSEKTPFSVSGSFAAAPGVFEIDVQVADTNVDAAYQNAPGGVINTVDAVNQTFYLDANITAKFVRLLMRTRTNAVNVSANITSGA